ncbi:hypothetical protein D9M70_485890 [compost metagenome]
MITVGHEQRQCLVGQQIALAPACCIDMAQLLQQHVEVFRRQAGQADHRPRKIHQPRLGEVVFRQARLQSRVAVEPAAGIHEELGRTAQHEAKSLRRALQGIVEDAQDLLVVGVACLRIGQFVQVDQFVEAHHQATETCQPNEPRKQLELIVNRCIVDDGSHAQRGTSISLGGELATQPANRICLELLVALFEAFAVSSNHIGEIVTVDHLRQLSEVLTNHHLTVLPSRLGLGLRLCDELLDDSLQSTTFRFGSSRQVLGQLGIQRTGLTASGM